MRLSVYPQAAAGSHHHRRHGTACQRAPRWCSAGLAVLLLLGAGQARASAVTAGATGQDDEAALLVRIRNAIGDARCSSDAQCRTLAVGEKACGGPERWVAWSVTSPQADKLPAWAAESARLARQRNERSGLLSNCQFNLDPGAVCQAQRCVPGTPVQAR